TPTASTVRIDLRMSGRTPGKSVVRRHDLGFVIPCQPVQQNDGYLSELSAKPFAVKQCRFFPFRSFKFMAVQVLTELKTACLKQ
ncbi:hypothetical protein, partial [Pandoraea sputorum]|uniref:hypothetical protein n=1 Tax=Pandoraea sputorum TaxID=93222 RepID=UPI0035572103